MITPDFFFLPGGDQNFKALHGDRRMIQGVVSQIAYGLFGLFQALGVGPPVLKLRDNDKLGVLISQKLADLYDEANLSSPTPQQPPSNRGGGSNPYLTAAPSRRCMVVLLDRYDDLQTMLYHAWTYLSLIQEVYGIRNNTIEYAEDPKDPNKKVYPLDFDSD